jgi:hypothetical protein
MNVYALNKHLQKIGHPQTIVEDLVQFRKDVNLLAKQRAKLTTQYPNKWIAFYEGKVLLIENSLDQLLTEIDRREIPRDKVITQFLSNKKRVMIL